MRWGRASSSEETEGIWLERELWERRVSCDHGSETGTVYSRWDEEGPVLRGNRRNLAGEGIVREISSLKRVASVPNLCNGWGQWVGNMGKGESCLELHGRRESRKDPKYPRRILVGETLGPCRGRQGPTGNRLRKGPIESGMLSDGSDTIPGHVPVQGTLLRS